MVAGTPVFDLLIRCFAVVSFLVPRGDHSSVRYAPKEQHKFVVNDCVRLLCTNTIHVRIMPSASLTFSAASFDSLSPFREFS